METSRAQDLLKSQYTRKRQSHDFQRDGHRNWTKEIDSGIPPCRIQNRSIQVQILQDDAEGTELVQDRMEEEKGDGSSTRVTSDLLRLPYLSTRLPRLDY